MPTVAVTLHSCLLSWPAALGGRQWVLHGHPLASRRCSFLSSVTCGLWAMDWPRLPSRMPRTDGSSMTRVPERGLGSQLGPNWFSVPGHVDEPSCGLATVTGEQAHQGDGRMPCVGGQRPWGRQVGRPGLFYLTDSAR